MKIVTTLSEIEIKRILAKEFDVKVDDIEIKEMTGDRGFPYIGANITQVLGATE